VRNTYTYIKFGNFIAGSTDRSPPYIQLLSTTNSSTEAHSEFVRARGGSNSPYPIPTYTPAGTNNNNKAQNWFRTHRKLLIAIVACAVGGLALCVLGCCLICRRKAQSGSRKGGLGSYARLKDHLAPGAATDIHMAPPARPWQPSQYHEPWGPKY
jgi:hypothetical protein